MWTLKRGKVTATGVVAIPLVAFLCAGLGGGHRRVTTWTILKIDLRFVAMRV
ncbi:MAG: hypothetical protein L7W43_00775 [Rubripirellula sp.]|nr:hypothetical protein [Rubripirellula sp.]